MMKSAENRRDKASAVFLVLLFLFVFVPSAVLATNQGISHEKAKTASLNDFTYTSQHRDPFERAHALITQNQLGAQALKSGYELEELKLVGVMKAGPEKFAVMEDMQGKGLFFKKGESLNKNLWVSEILDERIILAYRLRGDTRTISLNIPKK